jgi:hypothetical protein
MDTRYVRDDYDQYYLLVDSEVLYPEHGFALIATDGFIYEGGIGINDWWEVSEYNVPEKISLRLERVRERLEMLEEKLSSEANQV